MSSKGKAIATAVAYGIAISVVVAKKIIEKVREAHSDVPEKSGNHDVETASQPSQESCQVSQPNPQEESEIARAVRAFLSSSQLNGYISPFLELEDVRGLEDAQTVAHIINQAMCVVRYLCKSDPIYCRGALARMMEYLRGKCSMGLGEALGSGVDAVESEEFRCCFDEKPHEIWMHTYVMRISETAGWEEFRGMVQAMFITMGYPCPAGVLVDNTDGQGGVTDWAANCNRALEAHELMLVELDGNASGVRHYGLLKPLEYQVLTGMLEEMSVGGWAHRI